MRTFLGASLLALSVLVFPSGALAGSGPSSGVHVDPGSPAGKQYGFPVTSARGETSGSGKTSGKHSSGGTSGSGNGNPPLFGSGVSPQTTSTQSTTSAATATSAHKQSTHHRKQAANATHTTSTPAKPVSASPASHVVPSAGSTSAGSSAWIALVGGGLLVLVVGTGAGLALKRRLNT